MNNRYCHSFFSFDHFLHYFLNNNFNRFDNLLNSLDIPNFILHYLLYLQFFLNDYLIFTWNLNRSILLHNYFYFSRNFDSLWLLDDLVDWHLTILCVDNWLFNILMCFHRDLFYKFNWVVMSKSNACLVMNYFCFRDGYNLSCFLSNYIFLRNSYDIIYYFLYVFRHLYDLRDRPEHSYNWINFNIIQVDSLRCHHSKDSFIKLNL